MKGIYTLCNAVFLLALFTFLTKPWKLEKGFWGKLYHMLLLGWLKLDLALAHFSENIKIAFSHVFKGYRYESIQSEAVRMKEQRLMDHRQKMREASAGYKKKDKYNRKILE